MSTIIENTEKDTKKQNLLESEETNPDPKTTSNSEKSSSRNSGITSSSESDSDDEDRPQMVKKKNSFSLGSIRRGSRLSGSKT